jgi:hypothetical protein
METELVAGNAPAAPAAGRPGTFPRSAELPEGRACAKARPVTGNAGR